MPAPPLVEIRSVSKSFGRTRALDRVSFEVRAGEVHVLAGENGAGKSTLIKILSGVHAEDEGEVRVDGARVRLRSPRDARRAGIAAIHQELSLVGSMSVADNLFLGREVTGRLGLVDRAAERRRAAELLAEMDLAFDPDAIVEDLPLAARQRIEIARALAEDARVVVMDEPTSALNDAEAERLFAAVRRLVARGKGVVYISHRLEEIYALGDRITVLRDGAVVAADSVAGLLRADLVRALAGSAAIEGARDARPIGDRIALAIRDVRVERAEGAGRLDVDGVSLDVRRGEIVGLYGLRGSGTSELCHGIFGALGRRARGEVAIDGARAPILDPAGSIARGLVLLAADRRAQGIVPDLGVVENATLASLSRFSPLGWIARRREAEAVLALARRFRLAVPAADVPAGALSGGGQQKVYLMRCLLAAPRALVLDEPTRGVDVVAKAQIHEALRELAADGLAVLLVSSEIEELFALSHRVVVMRRGALAGEIPRADLRREAALEMAMDSADGGSARQAELPPQTPRAAEVA